LEKPTNQKQTTMEKNKTLEAVKAELDRALEKFPLWPTDPLHALAVVVEEVGELQKEVLQSVYEPHKSTWESVRKEAVQVAAMALRFLASLDAYTYQPGLRHEQGYHDQG
jgi:NTP pyrophosphatase (non-canonical NTP hydrolase)